MSVRLSALSILQKHYPQQLWIPLIEAARWIGIKAGTARNRVCAGTFPVPTRRFGDLRLVDIRDLAEYLDPQVSAPVNTFTELQPTVTLTPAKRSRGRPRKVQTDTPTKTIQGRAKNARAS